MVFFEIADTFISINKVSYMTFGYDEINKIYGICIYFIDDDGLFIEFYDENEYNDTINHLRHFLDV